MRYRWICLFTIVCFLLPQVAFAWGGGAPSGTRRKTKRSTTSKSTFTPPPPPPSVSPEHRHVVSSVSYYVQFRSPDGYFPVEDTEAKGKMWHLNVTEAPTVNKIGSDKYQVLGQFSGALEGEGSAVPVVVDFTLKGKDENWVVKDVKLHSVSGVER